jgi:hypothetical protein
LLERALLGVDFRFSGADRTNICDVDVYCRNGHGET